MKCVRYSPDDRRGAELGQRQFFGDAREDELVEKEAAGLVDVKGIRTPAGSPLAAGSRTGSWSPPGVSVVPTPICRFQTAPGIPPVGNAECCAGVNSDEPELAGVLAEAEDDADPVASDWVRPSSVRLPMPSVTVSSLSRCRRKSPRSGRHPPERRAPRAAREAGRRHGRCG